MMLRASAWLLVLVLCVFAGGLLFSTVITELHSRTRRVKYVYIFSLTLTFSFLLRFFSLFSFVNCLFLLLLLLLVFFSSQTKRHEMDGEKTTTKYNPYHVRFNKRIYLNLSTSMWYEVEFAHMITLLVNGYIYCCCRRILLFLILLLIVFSLPRKSKSKTLFHTRQYKYPCWPVSHTDEYDNFFFVIVYGCVCLRVSSPSQSNITSNELMECRQRKQIKSFQDVLVNSSHLIIK